MQQNLSDWNYHIGQVRNNEYLTEEQKKEVIDGIYKIREIFGENWLEKAVKTHHPLLWYLNDRVPHALLRILEFGKNLKDVENVQNFNGLLNNLKEARQFFASVAELKVAAKLRRAGIDMELYPKVDYKFLSHHQAPLWKDSG